ncbi:MAG: hypothetical protein M5U19_17785 [Microthrixaceae bacterium]|nr:hypothetical protein [Microthrixaceae bacterium]
MVDDIVIDVIVTPVPGYMGDATWCVVGDDGLPRLSVVRISTIGLDNLYDTGQLDDVVTHELGHALGLGTAAPWGALLQYTGDPTGYRFHRATLGCRVASPRRYRDQHPAEPRCRPLG